MCRLLPKSLTLINTKICDFPCSIYDEKSKTTARLTHRRILKTIFRLTRSYPLNNIHPTIKLASSHSINYANVPFLDVMVSLHNGTIETDLYTKPTDKDQHPLSSPCHPQHTKKAISISLALRIYRTYSTDAKLALRLNELRTPRTRLW